MCETCGCSDNSRPRLTNLQSGVTLAIGSANEHEHHHHHAHVHSPDDTHHMRTIITITIMTTISIITP